MGKESCENFFTLWQKEDKIMQRIESLKKNLPDMRESWNIMLQNKCYYYGPNWVRAHKARDRERRADVDGNNGKI